MIQICKQVWIFIWIFKQPGLKTGIKKLTFFNPFLIVKTYELISLYSNIPNLNTCALLIDFFKSSKALFCLLICFYRKVKINRSTNQIKQGDQAIIVIRKDLEFIFEVQLSLTDLPRVS